jgi:hypothetical protein
LFDQHHRNTEGRSRRRGGPAASAGADNADIRRQLLRHKPAEPAARDRIRKRCAIAEAAALFSRPRVMLLFP